MKLTLITGGYDFNTLRVQSITGSAVPTEETSQAGKELYTELVSNALKEILLATGRIRKKTIPLLQKNTYLL